MTEILFSCKTDSNNLYLHLFTFFTVYSHKTGLYDRKGEQKCSRVMKTSILIFTILNLKNVLFGLFPNGCFCGSVVEHCVSSAKVVGSIPREHMY